MIEKNENSNEQITQEKDQTSDNSQKYKVKKHFILKKKYQIRIIIAFIIIFVGGYIFGCIYYNNRFMANTTVNDVDVSGSSYQQASDQLKNLISNQNIVLTFIDNQQETISQGNCGITFNESSSLNSELKKQNSFLWFTHFFSTTNIEIDDLLNYNEDELNKTINQLEHLQSDQQVAPVDAKVEYKDNDFSIKEEEYGTLIDQDLLKKAILNAFSNGNTEVDVKKEGAYKTPDVTANDEKLQNLLTAAKKYCNASITYKTVGDDVVLDGNTLMSWLSIDESGNYYKDNDEFKKQATAFVKELAEKINIIGKSKTINGAKGKVTVSGGNYGYKLQQDKEIEGLLADINANKKETRTPITTGVQASYENGGVGNTFVEIDMTKQHMWFIKNGKIVLESDVVTGLPSDPNKKTPGGTYYIYFMQRNRTLRGEIQADGKPEYETPVAYWMAFNGGIGLHDATWQSKFGGNVYFTKGSHGCVNLPLDIAAALYDMVKVNIPVVCYY